MFGDGVYSIGAAVSNIVENQNDSWASSHVYGCGGSQNAAYGYTVSAKATFTRPYGDTAAVAGFNVTGPANINDPYCFWLSGPDINADCVSIATGVAGAVIDRTSMGNAGVPCSQAVVQQGSSAATTAVTSSNGCIGTPYVTTVFAPLGSSSAPAFASIANPNSGVYFDSSGNVYAVANGVQTTEWGAGYFYITGVIYNTLSNGWELANRGGTSATAPSFIPNKNDTKAGIGADASGDVSVTSDNAGTATEVARATGNAFTIQTTLVAKGTSPTLTTGSCSGSSAAGGSLAGKFTAPSCAGGTIIMSGLPAATNGYTCTAQDQTTPADTLKQTANSISSVTFTATTANNDVIAFSCFGW